MKAMTTIDEYLALPYRVEVRRNEDGYFARIIELPGCMTWTDRLEDLWPMVEDAKRAWIADALASGDAVPVPAADDVYATAVIVRLPKSLHRDLVRQARQTGTTLDTLVAKRLAR